MKRIPIPDQGLVNLFGNHEENLRYIEGLLKVQITARGDELLVDGDDRAARVVERIIWQLTELMEAGFKPSQKDFKTAGELLSENPAYPLKAFFLENRIKVGNGKNVTPRSVNQRRYVESIRMHDIVFGIGPAGTGKTYLAIAMAVSALQEKIKRRVILTRPAVEAGEKLGFLPGDMYEKVDPYLRPLFDAIHDMLDPEVVTRHISRGIIEIAPIAYMRGRTLNDSFVILDEAQNTSSRQMKMFLTRLGFNTKAVITGDVTQIDLPPGQVSGLKEAQHVLAGIEGISFIDFNEKDVVRHPLVKSIIVAYERHEQELPDAADVPSGARAEKQATNRGDLPATLRDAVAERGREDAGGGAGEDAGGGAGEDAGEGAGEIAGERRADRPGAPESS